MEDDWEIQHDINTLMEASAIKSDPERIRKAKIYAKEQADKMSQFAQADESDMEKGFTSRMIGEMFGVTKTAVRYIVSGKNWGHLHG